MVVVVFFFLTQTAYEQVKEAKEAASDLFKELVKIMIDYAPQLGVDFSNARKVSRGSV